MSKLETTASRLRAAIRFLMRQADAIGGPAAPSRSELGVMAWIEEKGPSTPVALATAQRVRPQSMGQTLDSLERRRWVRKDKHPTDRRQILVSLNASGLKALAVGRRRRQAWLVSQLRKITPQERKAVEMALTVFEKFVEPILPNNNPRKS